MNTDEAEIRSILEKHVIAIQQKNVTEALSSYSEEVISFDVIDPLQYIGLKEVRVRLENWFSNFGDSIKFEITDLKVTASGNVGFTQGLSHVSAVTKSGEKLDMYYRQTLCFVKENSI